VLLWDVEKRAALGSFPVDDAASELTFAPTGRTLATLGFREASLWDVDSRTKVAGLGEPVRGLDLSPDGRRLATHDFDRGFDHILIYDIDVKSWQERLCEIVGRDLTKEERATYLPGHPRLRACG
jgi:WD40 repeat protein